MKKMNKMYEAPVAEVIEMQSINVLMGSGGGDGTQTTGNVGGNGSGNSPWG